jgi:hypothetical protein
MARRLLVLVAVCILSILLGAHPSGAQDPPGGGGDGSGTETTVEPLSDTYRVMTGTVGGTSSVWATPRRGGGPTWVCSNVADDVGGIPIGWFEVQPPAPSDDHRSYLVRCTKPNGELYGPNWAWVAPADDGIDLDAAAGAAAARAVEDVIVPDIGIAVSPESGTLVGIETWFRLEGWDGRPLTETVELLGIEIAVTMRATSMSWDFGDGAEAIEASPSDDPAAPTVTHRYRHRSTVEHPDAGHALTLDMAVGGSYTFLGLGPFDLEPLALQVVESVVVREVQAVQR